MIHQIVHFNATSQQIYECLMDEKKHSDFTGAKAKIENKVNGTFSVWDGYATGKSLELVAGKKIVQEWYASDWPEGDVSKLTIEFYEEGDGTVLTLTQIGVPEEFEKNVESGWDEYYWKPLKDYLEN